MDFIQIITGQFLLNYTGGTLRFIYGTIWRTIFNKTKFTYKEYIYGPKKGNYYDKMDTNLTTALLHLFL